MIEPLYELFFARYNYWMAIILMLIGLYALIAKQNLVKKLIGLNIFQTAIFLFYISLGEVRGGTAPIYLPEGGGCALRQPTSARSHTDRDRRRCERDRGRSLAHRPDTRRVRCHR